MIPPVFEFHPVNGLRVGPVEVLRHPQQRGADPDGAAARVTERCERLLLRRRSPVKAGEQRHRADFFGGEAAEPAVPDQVRGVAVMAQRADVVPDVVEQRRVLQPFPLALPQAVKGAGLIEQ